jgi:tRNA threonylcarbamoyl adenosine modification protein (Sua5/YciO/YrdC/YwlC family)
MQIITKIEFEERIREFIEKIRNGAIFVYPTDTIYGIGCNALLDEPVKRIRKWKNRDFPFSVIVPGKDWIKKNCEVCEEFIDKLPGPYTLVKKMKKQVVSKFVTKDTVGVRIPAHWISDVVEKIGVPIVTTSVNVSGEIPLFSLDNIPSSLKMFLDFAIDAGVLQGKASEVIDCSSGKTLRRGNIHK